MSILSNGGEVTATLYRPGRRLAAFLAMALTTIGAAYATEGSGSVYPEGVETVLPGKYPPPGMTLVGEFNDFYDANELTGPNGHALLPGFHLRVAAVAVKVIHNWGVHVLGGTLVSTGALPWLDVHLNTPFGGQNKQGIGNADLETVVLYNKGALSGWYGFEFFPPGFAYTKGDLVNIGQHNLATAPSAAFTYMPHHGSTEVSSKVQYITNYKDDATNYRSGSEFVWEYDGMQNITKKLAIGGNGYYYQQATPDQQAGMIIGNQGRNVAFGPQIRYHFAHYAMILKWQKDFLTENRPAGNALWLEVGVPLGHPHQD
jgi:hypothetical protein